MTKFLASSTAALGARRPSARALVAIVTEGSAAAALTQWRQVNSAADWIRVDLREAPHPGDRAWLARKLIDLIDQRHMQTGQLVLLGTREAGRLALNLVLAGLLPCAGVVGVDIPCAPPDVAIATIAARIRLVLHESDRASADGGSLIAALRRADIDTRIMKLPSPGSDAAETTLRAASSFLFELIAIASAYAMDQGRFHHV